MKIILGRIIKVEETEKIGRIITVRVDKPWEGNVWEDYRFPDNSKFYQIGQEVDIQIALTVQLDKSNNIYVSDKEML